MLKLNVFVVVALMSATGSAEPAKVLKMGAPVFVTVDRRPEKDIKYSKCVGTFKTERGWGTAAVASAEDRVCPAADTLTMDVEENRTLTDGGKTEVTNHFLPKEAFESTYSFKGKDWTLGMHPKKVTAKIDSLGTPSSVITDTFYIALLWDKSTDEKMWMTTNKADSITEVFENEIKSEKPLAIGTTDGSTTRITDTKNGKVTHKE